MTLRRRADSIATAHLWLWSSDMYLLDTNVVSELRRPRPHGAVLDWIAKVPAEAAFRVRRYGCRDTGGNRDHPRAG